MGKGLPSPRALPKLTLWQFFDHFSDAHPMKKKTSKPSSPKSAPKKTAAGASPGKKSQRVTHAPAKPVEEQPRAKRRGAKETINAAEGASWSTFPIVGIGASAGGLEALEQFLRNVPEEAGMAFVIVQHLDPTHKGSMVELLQRVTRMQVSQAEDRVAVLPDRVYVIPPGKDLSVLHGRLHLLAQSHPRGLKLPIDIFSARSPRISRIGVSASSLGDGL